MGKPCLNNEMTPMTLWFNENVVKGITKSARRIIVDALEKIQSTSEIEPRLADKIRKEVVEAITDIVESVRAGSRGVVFNHVLSQRLQYKVEETDIDNNPIDSVDYVSDVLKGIAQSLACLRRQKGDKA